jgi:hypothetical protein
MVATVLMAIGLVVLAQMFAMATSSNVSSRSNTFTTVLAGQKMEQLRALTWGFDMSNLPVTDTTTNTAVVPETSVGGTGLAPSPDTALKENTPGYVDYVDAFGQIVGTGGATPPNNAVYTRRWSIEPLPTNPNNTIIIQVLVTPIRNRGQADLGNVGRLPDEARVVTVKTRKSQ